MAAVVVRLREIWVTGGRGILGGWGGEGVWGREEGEGIRGREERREVRSGPSSSSSSSSAGIGDFGAADAITGGGWWSALETCALGQVYTSPGSVRAVMSPPPTCMFFIGEGRSIALSGLSSLFPQYHARKEPYPLPRRFNVRTVLGSDRVTTVIV